MLASTAANAAIVVNIQQQGANVVATTSGSLNLAGLTQPVSGEWSFARAVRANDLHFGTGASNLGYGYAGFSGPGSLGFGLQLTSAHINTGSVFGITESSYGILVFLDRTYTSNASIAASSTFNNRTLAGMGLTVGQYVFASSNDTITINIGTPAAVPEPATWAMMMLGFGALGGVMRRRKLIHARVRYA